MPKTLQRFFWPGCWKQWKSMHFHEFRGCPPAKKTQENDGYSKTFKNLWKTYHFPFRPGRPNCKPRKASSWGHRILRKAYWKSLEILVFLAAQTCQSPIRTKTTAKEPWENDGYSKTLEIHWEINISGFRRRWLIWIFLKAGCSPALCSLQF